MNRSLIKKISKHFTWQHLLLLPLPLMTFIIRGISRLYTGPYWFASNFDPEYAYLFNFLNVIHFFKIEYVDHPGTPLQVFGGIVIFIYHLLFRGGKINDDLVLNSDLYLNVVNIVIIFLLSITLYIAGMVIYIKSKKIIYGLLIQITPFLSMTSIWTFHRVSPEPLLLIAGIWLSLFLYLLTQSKNKNYKINILILAVITGFIVSLKISSLAIVLILLIFLKLKDKLLYIFGVGLSFLVFTLPIISSYRKLFEWVRKLLTHSGRYGSGNTGFLNYTDFVSNLKSIVNGEQVMILIFLISLIVVIYLQLRRKNNDPSSNMLLGISIFAIIQMMLVSKHFAYHYLIPLLSVSGITVILILQSLFRPKKFKFIEIVVFLLLIIVAVNNFNTYKEVTSKPKANYSESIKIINFVKNNYDNYLKVYYYRSTSLEYALNFGNGYSVNKYNAELETYFPDVYFYDIWGRNFSYWGRAMPLPKNDKIIFQGTPFKGKNAKYKPEGYIFDNVFNGDIETVYELQGETD